MAIQQIVAMDIPDDHKEVVIKGEVFLYSAKAPFQVSGKSVKGAIEYNSGSGLMKCHECGHFVKSLNQHIRFRHKIPVREYKINHGLNLSTALVSDDTREKLSLNAKHNLKRSQVSLANVNPERKKDVYKSRFQSRREEWRNSASRCREQTLQKVQELAKSLNRTPTGKEMERAGIPRSDLNYHFGSIINAQKLAGLLPNSKSTGVRIRRDSISDQLLLQQLRIFFYNNGRIPRMTDVRRGFFVRTAATYVWRFGSFYRAIEIAFTNREIRRDAFWRSHQDKMKRVTVTPAKDPSPAGGGGYAWQTT